MGVRVTPSLDTLGTFVICNPAEPDLIQGDPAVAFDGENYVVVWADEKHGTSGYHTTVARVTPQGAVLDSGVRVSPTIGASEYRPNVAFDGERCLVVWYRSGTGIFGRFVDSAGRPEGDVITFATGGGGGPDLAFDGINYLVTWFTGTYPDLELHGRLVSRQGTLIGDQISIATGSGCHRWADVVFDGTNYLVVWQAGNNSDGQAIHGQFITTGGALAGERFRISDSTGNRRWWPAMAVSNSNFLVAWGQGSVTDIYGNVDALVTGVAEGPAARSRARGPGPTVFSGDLVPTDPGPHVVYDALGRRVPAGRLRPGVYFVEGDNRTARKAIRVP